MQFRNVWGRPLFHSEFPDDGGAVPPVPGAGEAGSGDPSPTPSGATSPVGEANPPGPIPYARFQEVNSQRRSLEEEIQPYRELSEAGYGADDLQRLTAWEQEYMQDPVGTWLRQAEQIENLPEAVKAAIASVGESGDGTQGSHSADGAPPSQESTTQVDEELRRRVDELQADRDARLAREQEEAVREFYDGLVSAWRQLDETQGIVTPEGSIHSYLAGASPNATSAEELLRTAREQFIADREVMLKGLVTTQPGSGLAPRSVPGSGGGSAPPVRPRTLQEAKKAAEADPMFANQP